MKAKNKDKEMDYAAAFEELSAMVKKWESGNFDLSQAANELSRAGFLVQFCRDYLRGIEQQTQNIQEPS
jgi:Exonuclease VII small subunit